MKKILIVLTLLLCVTGCFFDKEKKEPSELTFAQYEEKIKNQETFAMLIWRTGCSHCEAFEPKLNDIVTKYDLDVYSINTSNLEQKEYAKLKNKTFISGTPTLVYFEKGVYKDKLVGNKESDDVIKFFKEYKVIK